MRKLLVAIIVFAFALPALAVDCVQSDGQTGIFINGQGSPDDLCLTADEYAERFSVGNLVDVGVLTTAVDNRDGTATVSHALGGTSVVRVDPLSRPVAATPVLEPDAPTVGEVLFLTRLVTGGGPRES